MIPSNHHHRRRQRWLTPTGQAVFTMAGLVWWGLMVAAVCAR